MWQITRINLFYSYINRFKEVEIEEMHWHFGLLNKL